MRRSAGFAARPGADGGGGGVVDLDGEHQIDAVTAVSGSGPAYVST